MKMLLLTIICIGAVFAGQALASPPEISEEDFEKYRSFFQLRNMLELWALEHHNTYPQHINQIALQDLNAWDDLFPAGVQAVPFAFSSGNFTYLQSYDLNNEVDGFVLLVYGADAKAGFDVTGDGQADGVDLILLGGRHSIRPTGDGYVAYGVDTEQTSWLDSGRRVTIILQAEDCHGG